ncbi:MAG: hypothetical protein IJX24_04405 [Oscillospiraceae bacterium]|nr:hypothetical protein [Oscillospiraceae bacterium]
MKFRKLAIIFATVMALSGCSGKEGKTDTSKLPSDTPYCRNIMETESGYYYNVAQTLSLRYTEKATGKDIFLCAKPECMHDGNDACTATYNNLIVSEPVLYDGYIYFVGEIRTKEITGYSLYKAAPDGSSLDKITDIAEQKKPPQYDNMVGSLDRFIIHKGYAYVTYCMGQKTYDGYIGSGFAKVNIQTGEVEDIFKFDDFFSSASIGVYAGCGDYIYYSAYSRSSAVMQSGTYRYNIKTGESEKILDSTNGDVWVECFDEDVLWYMSFNDEKEFVITGHDSKTLEPNGIEINTGESAICGILYYEDKFFLQGKENITVLSNEGEKLGTIKSMGVDGDEMPDGSVYYNGSILDISYGKLYTSVAPGGEQYMPDKTEIYCCNIEDILNGKGKWEKAYTKNSWSEYWEEDPVWQVLQEEEGE